MAEDEEFDQPMRFLATDCNELFDKITNASFVNQQETVSEIIVYRDAFDALTSFLCIFNEDRSSLDYRLRNYESIQDIMIRLLELFRQNIFTVSNLLLNAESDPLIHFNSPARMALDGIKESLKSLNKNAMTIRQSSRSYALTLARNFATSNRALEDLEELILISLETLYPNASETLREHICNTLTDRYARLEYSAYINGKSRSKSSTQAQSGEAPPTPIIEGEAVRQTSIVSGPKNVEFDYIQKKTQQESPSLQQKPLSSLDTRLLRQSFNNAHIKTAQSKRTLSVYESDSHLHEPKPPKFESGEVEVQCDWCDELLDRSVVRNNTWSNIGRLHYKRDLKPFPCVSETCGESRPTFPSRKQWLEHMRSKHSVDWPQSLYGEMMWVCDDHVEDGESITYAFSSENDLDQHMLLIHRREERLSTNEVKKCLKQQPSIINTLSPSSCPLCFFVAENSLEAKQTKSLNEEGVPQEPSEKVQSSKKNQQRVESRVRFSDDVEAASDVDIGDKLDHDSSDLFALEIHMAAHLQYLLVVSLRLMETLDHETDEGSIAGPHSSNDPATRFTPSIKDSLDLDTLYDEDPELVYISDSQRSKLEEIRLDEETAIPPPYEEGQWDNFYLIADGSTENDSILQHFSSKKNDLSRIEFCRNSVIGLRQDLTKAHNDHVDEGYLWREIAILQAELFRQSRDRDDLNQAIEAFEMAVEKMKFEDSDMVQNIAYSAMRKNLADLSTHLVEKYKIDHLGDNLDKAIEIERALFETNNETQQPLDHCLRLSNLLRWRYIENNVKQDLKLAVEMAQKAKKGVPDDSGIQAKYYHHLGELSTQYYWRTGNENAIDQAISQLRIAVEYTNVEDNEHGEYLEALSAGLGRKFAISGYQETLDEAMKFMRLSIDLVSQHDLARLRRLNSLGVMLGELYDKTGAKDALEECIRVAQNVVDSTPKVDKNAANRMAHLAARLQDSFQNTGSIDLLQDAIRFSSTAKALTPTDHPMYGVYCHNLAASLFQRYQKTGSIDDLREITLNSRKAVVLSSDTNANMATYLFLLADATMQLGNHLGDHEQQNESLRLYESALSHRSSAFHCRLQAGQRLFKAYVQSQNWLDAYRVSKITLECLTQLPFVHLGSTVKRSILQTTSWLPSEGVAVALEAGRPTIEVLSLLEDSRCLNANSGVCWSDDIQRLGSWNPKLQSFNFVRKDLAKVISVSPAGLIDNSPWQVQPRTRDDENIKHERRLLAEIRKRPGFSNWLTHDDEAEMLQAGAKGPVIVLTTSYIRCDAIIIYRDKIEVLRLPDLDHKLLVTKSGLRGTSARFTLKILLWLWESIAEPVLVHLGLSPTAPDNQPRLWLIPTGPLTNLPIHAAGDYTRQKQAPISISDYVVCSYSTSIKALNSAREPTAIPDGARAFFVGNREDPVSHTMSLASKEISDLGAICRSRGFQVFHLTLKHGVLPALASCTLFHFAGGFSGNKGDPFESKFLVKNNSITVEEVLKVISQSPSPPCLAYLSSSDTSRTLDIQFTNECLHAAGALYMGGFRHTIGALGAVEDMFCAEISGRFYRAWADRGFADDAVALCLNDAARQCRNLGIGGKFTDGHIILGDDNDDEKEMDWASFVHFGP